MEGETGGMDGASLVSVTYVKNSKTHYCAIGSAVSPVLYLHWEVFSPFCSKSGAAAAGSYRERFV